MRPQYNKSMLEWVISSKMYKFITISTLLNSHLIYSKRYIALSHDHRNRAYKLIELFPADVDLETRIAAIDDLNRLNLNPHLIQLIILA